jgi:hypothetical protein
MLEHYPTKMITVITSTSEEGVHRFNLVREANYAGIEDQQHSINTSRTKIYPRRPAKASSISFLAARQGGMSGRRGGPP